jgi:hypothetical protein
MIILACNFAAAAAAGFVFTSCGNTGSHGPTAHQCQSAYKQASSGDPSSVTVIGQGPLAGIQVWTVPETATYGYCIVIFVITVLLRVERQTNLSRYKQTRML